jgi:flagellar biosynthesis anti-sigma factor FlgM
MRINSIPPTELYTRYIYVKDKADAKKVEQGTDSVVLTDKARVFSAALKEAKQALNTPNTEKVERIKRQLQSGTYDVPGEKVAEKLLGRE